MIKSEIIFGIIFLLISLIFFALTFQFPEISIALSPKVYPRFVTCCLFLLSLILIYQGIRKQVSEKDPNKKIVIGKFFYLRFVILFICAFIYLYFLNYFGFLILTPFFIASSMIIFDEKKWYNIILISFFTTIILYVVFRVVFHVPLPRHIFW